jgi:putative ABC transport system permease protein
MKALHIKLWRDLQRLYAQALTIAMVVAIGVAGFVGMFSVHDSLLSARDGFYRANHFADVFAQVRRAPLHLEHRLAAIEGVVHVQAGIGFDTRLDLGDTDAPVTGRFIGLDLARVHADSQGLNRLTLVQGRWPEAGAQLEALVNDRFASARGLQPGDTVWAVLNGRQQQVHLVGTVISPEYVFATQGGAPDDTRYGIWWIDHQRMAQLFDMEGAFNQVALALAPQAQAERVIDMVDALLTPYGSIGAVGRDRQLSAKIVQDEMSQLRVMGTVLPAIFLAVAMLVLNGVISRQVTTQRNQIAALKALGYHNADIGWHYLQLSLLIAAMGVFAGLVLSVFIGRSMLSLYDEMFRFHQLSYTSRTWLVLLSVGMAALAAAAGTWSAIRAVVRLSPAQAMQPPAPPAYRASVLERLGLGRHVATGTLMVIRQFERRPLRAVFTIGGMAMAVALQISGAFWLDTINHMIDTQFRRVQQGDVMLSFHRPVPPGVVHELQRLPGVIDAEVYRMEPVRAHHQGHQTDTVVMGLQPAPRLLRLVDAQHGPAAPPAEGVILSALLARELQASPGSQVQLTFRLWSQREVEVEVVDVVNTLFGQQLYMSLDTLNRLAGDGDGAANAALQTDPLAQEAFWRAIRDAPAINSVFDKSSTLDNFQQTTARIMGIFSGVLTLFAVAMAVGIMYNTARIALSERAWELASLRVLGMTRREVSVLLLSELALMVLVALPLGTAMGWGLAHLLMALMASDAFDFPVIIAPSTYASAVLIMLVAAITSALLVRRQVDQLDLVAVLKVRV